MSSCKLCIFFFQSNDPDETIPLSAFQQKHRPRQNNPLFSPPKFVPSLGSPNADLVSNIINTLRGKHDLPWGTNLHISLIQSKLMF